MRRDCDAQQALAALTRCAAGSAAGDWQLRRLSQGGQAQVFAAQRETPGGAVVSAATLPEMLIVKRFAPAAASAEVIQEQGAVMAELRSAVHGSQANGWQIAVPRVISCDPVNRTLVMEHASGQPVRQLMTAAPTQAVWQPWADVMLCGLTRYWHDSGRIYGDLNLRNILCDPAHQTIAFIDAGAPGAAWHFPQPPCQWFPASRDLAYLLFFVATEIKANLLQPRLRHQQLMFVDYLLRRFMQQSVAAMQRAAFVQELRHGAERHLAALHSSWTPRGIWTRQVRQTAAETIERVLRQLGGDHDQRPSAISAVEREAAVR